MAERSINAAIKSKLVANEPFQYAHLIKFERPFDPDSVTGKFRTNDERYAYYTDASHDIAFDDGTTDQDGTANGSQTYRANRITSIGQYSETTTARATTMNLTLAAEDLGAKVTVNGVITVSGSEGTFTPDITVIGGETLDFIEEGFKEGDKIKFAYSSTTKIFIIDSFTTNNTIIKFKRTGNDSDDAALAAVSSTSFVITLESDELTAVIQDRGITISSTAAASPNFLNRKVFVHKVFIDLNTGALVGGANTSILVFKGIIANVSIQESLTKTQVKWSLTSHWGDFEAVQGRLTTDEVHRSLNPDGSPSIKQAIRPEYAGDLGFLHAETSLNTIATYQTQETKYRQKKKRRGGLAGLFGGKYYIQEEYQVEVDNEVDLNIHLAGKELPVVYGVQRVEGVPIFADTLAGDPKEVYIVYTICEGEIHGLYNLYIDDIPIICTDDNDFDVRNTSNGTDKDNSQLQCYGNMSKGQTLNAEVIELETAKTNLAVELGGLTTGSLNSGVPNASRTYNEFISMALATARGDYKVLTSDDINEQALTVGNASGMQHEESFSIEHPYVMTWVFHSGRANQTADNSLITIAENTTVGKNFKRQADYYTGNLPYWAENHRLLDTVYAVTKFVITGDATEVPEIEYIVKGKVLECHNYDNSYIPDAVLGSGNTASQFTEGDLVTVEYSTDGSSWTADTSGNWTSNKFKILDKYTFTTSRGTQHTRFRLDKTPNLNILNGAPTRTRLRLKNSSNQYWYMITWNHGLVTTEAAFPDNWKDATWDLDSGKLRATVSSGDKTALGTDDLFFQFRRSSWAEGVSGLKYGVLRGVWSGNAVTFQNTDYTGLTTELNGTQIATATTLPFNVGTVNSVTNVADVEGSILKNTTTGEEREITDFNTGSSKNLTIETPFFTPSTEDHNFTITGRGKDSRSSSNPAIQTLDYIRSKRFGKNLTDDDLDLDSFITAAKLCDVRSDITISVEDASGVAVDDIFTLTDDGASDGNHIASGKVVSIDETAGAETITLTQVINKFAKKFSTFTSLVLGDIVYTEANRFYRAASPFVPTTDVPTHETGTTNGLAYIGKHSDDAGDNPVKIWKTAGNGTASSLNYTKKGLPIEYSLYDSDWIKYWRYYGWEQHHQRWVTRHQTNFIIDTGKSVFQNMNALLSHYNGILSYENGKYVLDVETQETAPVISLNASQENINPFYIENSDIIGTISLKDSSQRVAKNTIKASIADPQNNYGSRSITFFNSDFLEADRNVIKTAQFPFTGITNYYNARINVEKELFQTRFSKEVSFTIGPRGILLRAGEVIAITYEPFGWTSKLFRIENLTFKADCNVSVKAREYDDSIYKITKQQAGQLIKESSGQFALKPPLAPGSAAGTGDDLTATQNLGGSVLLEWGNGADYNEVSDSTEIWFSTDNDRANAALLTTVDNAEEFTHTLAGATRYYWVRHRRVSQLTQSNARITVYSDYFPTSVTGGVTGISTDISAGAAGLNQSMVSLYYLNNDTGTTPAHPDTDLEYTFADKELTVDDGHETLDGWTKAFPQTTASLGVRWVTMAVASSNTSTDDIEVADWSDSVVIGDDKNVRHAQVDLYQRAATNSAPADPDGNLTYTFATGVLSGSNFNSWTVDIPASGNVYIFKISAVALGNVGATTDTIASGDWSAAALQTSPGDTGSTGAGTNFIFARQTAKPPTPTANGLNIPSASIQWYDDPPTSPLETLWASKGTVAAGGTAYVWGAVFQPEGTAVAELRIYSDVVASNGSSPTKPTTSQSFFNIATSVLTIGNNDWNATPPSVTNNGDTVYSCTSLVSGSPTATAVAVSWENPTIFARKTDGTTTYTWTKYGTNSSGAGLTDTYSAGTTTYIGLAFNKTTATESTTAGDYTWHKLEGEDGTTTYTWIKYGTDINGANLTNTYTEGTTTYVGHAYNKTTATESTTAGDYTWSKLEGDDGDTTYTWVKYGTNASGAGLTDTYSAGTTTYIGMAFNKTTATESTTAGDYLWTKIEGEDGVTTYTWVKYGTSSSGAGLTDTYTAGTTLYIGMAFNKTTATESTTAGDYTWTKIEGVDGDNLTQTVPAYKSAKKNPNPSVVPSANGASAPSGYSFNRPAWVRNYRIYESQGTLSGGAYSWTVALSQSSNQPFTFFDDDVIDGGPDYAGAEYEVNQYDIWIDTTADKFARYTAQANFSDAISATEWKEGMPDEPPVVDLDESSLPNVAGYKLGDIVLLGTDFYIVVDF